MKELLLAIQSRLQAATELEYIRETDIYISPDPAFLPESTRLPAIGICDFGREKKDTVGGGSEYRYAVHLAVFQEINKPEASIVGDVAGNRKGILDICEHIESVLFTGDDAELLGISGMIDVTLKGESRTEPFGDKNGRLTLIRKIMHFAYEREIVT